MSKDKKDKHEKHGDKHGSNDDKHAKHDDKHAKHAKHSAKHADKKHGSNGGDKDDDSHYNEKSRAESRHEEDALVEEKEELHPPETVTKILLIRHGHTEATELGLLYSDTKMPMTEKGKKQSQAAAEYALSFKPDVIVRGTAVRVEQACEPLATLTGLKPVVVKGFEEWNVGEWEGRTYLDIKKNDPDEYHEWSADPVNNAPPGGESIDDLVQRIGRSLRQLYLNKEFNGKRIAMVTHSGIIRSIIVQALDMPVSNFWRIAVPTGSVCRIDFSNNFATLQFSGVMPEQK